MAWNSHALRVALHLCAAAAPLMSACAETDKAPAPRETVKVEGLKPAVQVLPDRTVYSLDKNVQGATGSLSDVLRNLPSVDVDMDGNVTLRGDANVTILIDGKTSALLAGNRGEALQQIPANLVDRIEVITSPSAEFRAEGSGGIINIVMRKEPSAPPSGIVRVNIGNQGRANASASGNVRLGHAALSGAYGEVRDTHAYASSTQRTDSTLPRTTQSASAKLVFAGRYATLFSHYGVDENNQIELGGSYNRFGGHYASKEHNISFTDSSDISRDGFFTAQREGAQAQINYKHAFAAKGEEFSSSLNHSTAWVRFASNYTNSDTATGVPEFWQSRRSIQREGHTEFKADYILPQPHDGAFKAGYALQNDSNLANDLGVLRDLSTPDWRNDTGFTSYFVLDRTVHATYVNYEQKYGAFGLMAGLRLEWDALSTEQRLTGEVHEGRTIGLYPSAHLSYHVSETQQLELSYSRRLNRPAMNALNPTRFSLDAFNVQAGNPALKAEQIDAFESSYRYVAETFDLTGTGFYRATYKGITQVYLYQSNNVLLATWDNLARRSTAGLEVNANATPMPGVTLRSSGSLAYEEFNPGVSAIAVKQSGTNWTIKGGIDWQITPDDLFQLNAKYVSKQRFAQGYYDPSVSGDLGFKHSFEGGFAAVFSANNLFHSWNRDGVLNAPGVHQVDHRAMLGRTLYFGLVYAFGGAKDTEGPARNDGGYQGGF